MLTSKWEKTMSTRVMYDGVTIGRVPTDGDLYSAYIDGTYKNYDDYVSRFPHKRIVKITVSGAISGEVCDRETGDLTPEKAAVWALAKHKLGEHPTIYVSEAFWNAARNAVKTAFKDAGIKYKRHYVSWWVAWYGKPNGYIPRGAIACQNVNAPGYDRSTVANKWPGIDPVVTRISLHHRIMIRALNNTFSRRHHAVNSHDLPLLANLETQTDRIRKIQP
jgi:hypothetical protein